MLNKHDLFRQGFIFPSPMLLPSCPTSPRNFLGKNMVIQSYHVIFSKTRWVWNVYIYIYTFIFTPIPGFHDSSEPPRLRASASLSESKTSLLQEQAGNPQQKILIGFPRKSAVKNGLFVNFSTFGSLTAFWEKIWKVSKYKGFVARVQTVGKHEPVLLNNATSCYTFMYNLHIYIHMYFVYTYTYIWFEAGWQHFNITICLNLWICSEKSHCKFPKTIVFHVSQVLWSVKYIDIHRF